MNSKKLIMIMTALMLMLVPAAMVAADSSDANIDYKNVYQDKITPSGGNIHIVFECDESVDRAVTITVVNASNSKTVGTATVTVPAGSETYDAAVNVNFGGVGSYDAKITWTYEGGSGDTTDTFNVTADVWSNWTTYVALIVIVLLVILALVIHSRSTPKVKADTTFTALETQKGDSETAAPAPKSTERKRYTASSSKAEPLKKEAPKAEPVKEAPKKESFTDLENKKKAEESSEPKKLKYVSSRRK